MTLIDTGTTGAKANTWKAGPRQLLRDIVEKVGFDSKEDIFAAFEEAVTKPRHVEVLSSIIEWWVKNNLEALKPYTTRKRSAVVANHINNIKSKYKDQVRRQARVSLLNLKLPNGKKLRDCTGDECKTLGRYIGRWLGLVAAKVKPTQKVGVALNEDQVRKIYDSFA